MSTKEIQVVSGAVIAYRLFDIADTIDLTKAEALWEQQRASRSPAAALFLLYRRPGRSDLGQSLYP